MNRETTPSRHLQASTPSRVGYFLLRSLPVLAFLLGVLVIAATDDGGSNSALRRASTALMMVGLLLFICQVLVFFPSSLRNRALGRRRSDSPGGRTPVPNRMPTATACYQVVISLAALIALVLPALGSAGRLQFASAALNFLAFYLLTGCIMIVVAWLQTDADARWIEQRAAKRQDLRERRTLSPRKEPAPLSTPPTTQRRVAVRSRLRRRPPGRARVHSFVEWTLLAFVVLGFPLTMFFMGPGSGMFSYVAISFILLAVTNRVSTWASEPIWTPGNAAAEERKRQGRASGARFFAAHPTRVLRHMRTLYLTLVVTGFFGCLVWPFLQGWPPERKYPFAATYVVSFLIGLILLSLAERRQRERERAWLKQQQAERSGA